ncbi:conserved hypothetical protein [Neospora caninum Liverpool]|uniref:Alpha/beta hydrolase family protein n=1 Tax=Neospora caninum (strain Liverpool) TaxID=572307 RepID=F0VNA1_NEOCL|nr:conserved hypothetical protein [Neospora caninum Liverpool]CBZ55197.1 conserved hypothetical protein [Neospora caninum Liverpool]CEL69924.1 TPA: hypothetical protein BN1204_056210 [Neospora caninum Liverpool]|eukprot:XP_003885225.1 conserved hypothetical protein [Neospora caninum Liverpool]
MHARVVSLFFAPLRACFASCTKWVLAPGCRLLKPAVAASTRFAAANAFPLALCFGLFAVFLVFLFLFSFFCSLVIGGIFAFLFALVVLYNLTTALLFPGSSAFFRRQLELQFCTAAIIPFKGHLGVLELLLSFLLYRAYLRDAAGCTSEGSNWNGDWRADRPQVHPEDLPLADSSDDVSSLASLAGRPQRRPRPSTRDYEEADSRPRRFIFPRWPSVASLPPSPASFAAGSPASSPSAAPSEPSRAAPDAAAPISPSLVPFPPPLLLAPERSPAVPSSLPSSPWLLSNCLSSPEALVADVTMNEVRESTLALSSLLRTMAHARRKIGGACAALSPTCSRRSLSPSSSRLARDRGEEQSAGKSSLEAHSTDSFEEIELSAGAPGPSNAAREPKTPVSPARERETEEGQRETDARPEDEKQPAVELGWERQDAPQLARNQRGQLTWQQEDVFYHGSQLLFHLVHLSIDVVRPQTPRCADKSRHGSLPQGTGPSSWSFLALFGLAKPCCAAAAGRRGAHVDASPSPHGDRHPRSPETPSPEPELLSDPSLCSSAPVSSAPSPLPPLRASVSELALSSSASARKETAGRPWCAAGGGAIRWPVFHCAAALFHLRQLLLFLSPHLPSPEPSRWRRRSSLSASGSGGILEVPALAALPRSLLRMLISPPLSSLLLLAGELEETHGGTELWIPVSEAHTLRLLLSACALPVVLAKRALRGWLRGRRRGTSDVESEAQRACRSEPRLDQTSRGAKKREKAERTAAVADTHGLKPQRQEAGAPQPAPGTDQQGGARARIPSAEFAQASVSLACGSASSPEGSSPAGSASSVSARLCCRLGAWLEPESRLYLHAVFFPAPNTHWLLPSTAFSSPPVFRPLSNASAAQLPWNGGEDACSAAARRAFPHSGDCLLSFVPPSVGACECCHSRSRLASAENGPFNTMPASPRARLTYRLFLLFTQLQRQEQVEVYVHSAADDTDDDTASSRDFRLVRGSRDRGDSRTLPRRRSDTSELAWPRGDSRLFAPDEARTAKRINGKTAVFVSVAGAVTVALASGAWCRIARFFRSLASLVSALWCTLCRRAESSRVQRSSKAPDGESLPKRNRLPARRAKLAPRFVFRCACTATHHEEPCLALDAGRSLGGAACLPDGEVGQEARKSQEAPGRHGGAAAPSLGGNVLIFFNPNAGYLETAAVIGDGELDFYRSRGVSVLLFNYRGFGRSAGKSSPASLLSDAAAIYRFVASWPGVQTVGVHGRSIGGMPAIFVALRQRHIRRSLLASVPSSAALALPSRPRRAAGVRAASSPRLPSVSFLCADRTFSSLPDAAGGLLGSWAYWGVRGAALTAHVGFSLSRVFSTRRAETRLGEDAGERGSLPGEKGSFFREKKQPGESTAASAETPRAAGFAGESEPWETEDMATDVRPLEEDVEEAARSCRLGARSVHAFLACTNVHKVVIADPEDEVVREAASLKAGVARALLRRRQEAVRQTLVHAFMAERRRTSPGFAGSKREERTDSDPSLASAPLLGEATAVETEGAGAGKLAGKRAGNRPGFGRALQACGEARRQTKMAVVGSARSRRYSNSSSEDEDTPALCRRRATRAVRSLHCFLSSSSLPTAATPARTPASGGTPRSLVRASGSFASSRVCKRPSKWFSDWTRNSRPESAGSWRESGDARPHAVLDGGKAEEREKALRSLCEEEASVLLHEQERQRKRALRRVPAAWLLLGEVVHCARLLSLSPSEGDKRKRGKRTASEKFRGHAFLRSLSASSNSSDATEAAGAAGASAEEASSDEGGENRIASRRESRRRLGQSLTLRSRDRRSLSRTRREDSRLEAHAEQFPVLREALRTCARRVNARLRQLEERRFFLDESDRRFTPPSPFFSPVPQSAAEPPAAVRKRQRKAFSPENGAEGRRHLGGSGPSRPRTRRSNASVYTAVHSSDDDSQAGSDCEDAEASDASERQAQGRPQRQPRGELWRHFPLIQISVQVLGIHEDAGEDRSGSRTPRGPAHPSPGETPLELTPPSSACPSVQSTPRLPRPPSLRRPLESPSRAGHGVPDPLRNISALSSFSELSVAVKSEPSLARRSPRGDGRAWGSAVSQASLKLVFLSQQSAFFPRHQASPRESHEALRETHLAAWLAPEVSTLLAAVGGALAGIDAGGLPLGSVLAQVAEKSGKRDRAALAQFSDVLAAWGSSLTVWTGRQQRWEDELETRHRKLLDALRGDRQETSETDHGRDTPEARDHRENNGEDNTRRDNSRERNSREEHFRDNFREESREESREERDYERAWTFATCAFSSRREYAVLLRLGRNLPTFCESGTHVESEAFGSDTSRFFLPHPTAPRPRLSPRTLLSPRPRERRGTQEALSGPVSFAAVAEARRVFAAAETEVGAWERERASDWPTGCGAKGQKERKLLSALRDIVDEEGGALFRSDVLDDVLTLLRLAISVDQPSAGRHDGREASDWGKNRDGNSSVRAEDRGFSSFASNNAGVSKHLAWCAKALRVSRTSSADSARRNEPQTAAGKPGDNEGDTKLDTEPATNLLRDSQGETCIPTSHFRSIHEAIFQLLRAVLRQGRSRDELDAWACGGPAREESRRKRPDPKRDRSSLLLPFARELGFPSVPLLFRHIQQAAERAATANREGAEKENGEDADAQVENLPGLPATRADSEPRERREQRRERQDFLHVVESSSWADGLAAFMRLQAIVSVYRVRTTLRRHAALFLLLYRNALYPPPLLASSPPSSLFCLSASRRFQPAPSSENAPRRDEGSPSFRARSGDGFGTLRRGTVESAFEDISLDGSESVPRQTPSSTSRGSSADIPVFEGQRETSGDVEGMETLEAFARSRALWMLRQELLLFIGERISRLLDFVNTLWSAYLELPLLTQAPVSGSASALGSRAESREKGLSVPLSGDTTPAPVSPRTGTVRGELVSSSLLAGDDSRGATATEAPGFGEGDSVQLFSVAERQELRKERQGSKREGEHVARGGEAKDEDPWSCPLCLSPSALTPSCVRGHLLPSKAGHNGPLGDDEFLLLHLHLLAANFIDPEKFGV